MVRFTYPRFGVASILMPPGATTSTRHPKRLGLPIALGRNVQLADVVRVFRHTAAPDLRPVFTLKTPALFGRFST